MLSDFIIEKVRTFHAKAGSMWGQKDAEAIWKENTWKLGLEVAELKALQDGWAAFVIKGDRSQLDSAAQMTTARLSNK